VVLIGASPHSELSAGAPAAGIPRPQGTRLWRRVRRFHCPLPVTLPPVSTWQDLPAWLSALVANTWQRPEWDVWERVWRPELAKRGVTPGMLEPVGDPDLPTGISASPAGKGWRSGRIDWEADADRTAVLTGLRRLVDELDQP